MLEARILLYGLYLVQAREHIMYFSHRLRVGLLIGCLKARLGGLHYLFSYLGKRAEVMGP